MNKEINEMINRKYIGRTQYISAIENFLSKKNTPHLHFHGIGGIGKSSLKRIVQQKLIERDEYICLHLDFEYKQYHSISKALVSLSGSVKKHYKFARFPSFNIAYAYYWKKVNPNLKIKEDFTLPFLEEGDLSANIYNIFEESPLIGIVPKTANFGFKALNKFKKWQEQSGFKDFKQLEELEAEEIEMLLVKLWAEDFNRIVKSKEVHSVLILDTLENIGNLNQGKFLVRNSFEWVEKLIQSLTQVSVISFGREQLEKEKKWGLIQFEVSAFDFEETCELLRGSYINNKKISEALFISTKGIPYYLDLAIKTYNQIGLARVPTSKDFEGNLEKVVERFVKYLNHEERAILEVLSVPKGWDKKLYDTLFLKEDDLIKTRANFIEGCNFVTYNKDLSQYTMHSLMREYLLKNLKKNSERYALIVEKVYNYNKAILLTIDYSTHPDYLKYILEETFYHAKELVSPEDFISNINKICPLLTSPNYDRLLNEIIEFVNNKNKDIRALYHLNSTLAAYYIYYTSIDKANIYIQATGEIFNKLDKENQSLQILHFTILQIKYYAVRKDYKQTEIMILEIIDMLEDVNRQEELQSLKNELYGNLTFIYIQLGFLEKANYYSELSLQSDQQENTFNFAMKLSNGGLVKLKKFDYNKALKMFDKGLSILEELEMLRCREYFVLKANQAEALWGLKKYEKAKGIHEEVLKQRIENLGYEHADVAESYLYVTMIYTTEKQNLLLRDSYLNSAIRILSKLNPSHNLAKAYSLYMQLEVEKEDEKKSIMYGEQSLEIRKLIYDSTSIELVYGYQNLGVTYAHYKKFEKAIECFNEGIKILKNQKDEHDVKMFISMSKDKGEVLRDLGLYKDAKVIYQEIVPLLESEALEQANILNVLGVTLRHLEDYKGAEKVYKKALRIRINYLPENHRDVAVTHLNLGIAYHLLKAKKKEKEHLEESFNIFSKDLVQHKKELFQVCGMLVMIYKESGNSIKFNYYKKIALSLKGK